MNDKLSLTELQLIIKESLYAALPEMYWVVAEISEIRENYAGHCFIELVEKHPDEVNIRARVKAVIWSKRYRLLKTFFENITGETLKEGFKVLVKVTVEYHEVYGLSLIINDIDPAFTIGEMAIKRHQILKKLEQEGILSMNKELEFPLLPKRIAVISSKTAAGYSDFTKHLAGNSYGYSFCTALFESVMQGTETESSVTEALNSISENIQFFDVVVIIRGGGSVTDLSWFDNYNIAYYITQFPIPVITGIGHEKDMSVTDIVAYRSEKTPTAVADFLVNCIREVEDHIDDMSSAISELSASVIEFNKELINSDRMKLIPIARMMLAEEKEKLSGKIIGIINVGKEYIVREQFTPSNQKSRLVSAVKSFLNALESKLIRKYSDLKHLTSNSVKQAGISLNAIKNTLNILSPQNILRRGYTITLLDNRILKNTKMVDYDDIIETQFSKGFLKSKVSDKK